MFIDIKIPVIAILMHQLSFHYQTEAWQSQQETKRHRNKDKTDCTLMKPGTRQSV